MANDNRTVDFKLAAHDETGKAFAQVDKRLEQLNKNLGKGGVLGGTIQSASTMIQMEIGNRLADGFVRASEKALQLSQLMREGKAEWADLGDTLTEGIPIVGQGWKAGRNLREVWTGEKFSEELSKKQSASLQQENDARLDYTKSWASYSRKMAGDINRMTGEMRISDLYKEPLKQAHASLNLSRDEALRGIDEQERQQIDQRRSMDQKIRATLDEQAAQATQQLKAANQKTAIDDASFMVLGAIPQAIMGLQGRDQENQKEGHDAAGTLAGIKAQREALDNQLNNDLSKIKSDNDAERDLIRKKNQNESDALDYKERIATEDSITNVVRAAEDNRFAVRKAGAIKTGEIWKLQEEQIKTNAERAMVDLQTQINRLSPDKQELIKGLRTQQNTIAAKRDSDLEELTRQNKWGRFDLRSGLAGTGMNIADRMAQAAGGSDLESQLALGTMKIQSEQQQMVANLTRNVLQNPLATQADKDAAQKAMGAAGTLAKLQQQALGAGYTGPTVLAGAQQLTKGYTGAAMATQEESVKLNTSAQKEASQAIKELTKAMTDLLTLNNVAQNSFTTDLFN